MKFILTGGGTGGHVYPAIAIAESIRSHFADSSFLYIGVRGRAEEKIVPQLGFRIRFVIGSGVAGSSPGIPLLLSALKLGAGLVQALFIVMSFRPDAVIGTGGYASVPAVLATVILKKLGLSRARIFIHEQNFAPGRWNRIVSRLADRVWTSFEDSRTLLPGARVEFTGYPVRQQIVAEDRSRARAELGIPSNARVLLVFGGSQGARTINRALAEALPRLLSDERIHVFHGTGAMKTSTYDAVADTERRVAALGLSQNQLGRYHPRGYITDIQKYYAAADLLVCRAGAGTLNEICRLGKPAIVIPKSNLVGEHQAINAQALAGEGACEVLFERPEMAAGNLQARVDGGLLAERLQRLLDDEHRLQAMSEAALRMNVPVDPSVFARSVESAVNGSTPQETISRPAAIIWGNLETVRLAGLSPAAILAEAARMFDGKNREAIDAHPYTALLRYFADIFLVHPRWQIRNVGVKLAGVMRYGERRSLLVELAGDRTPARLWKRFLSRDYRQVGFIRRNALVSLAQLGQWDEALRELLLSALSEDPYYEVRVEAARAIIALRQKIGACERLTGALLEDLNHRSLEVRWSCLEALGAVVPSIDRLPEVERYIYHHSWKIRQALITAVELLFERGLAGPDDPLVNRVEQLIPTCTDFTPSFPLKHSLARMSQLRKRNRQNAGHPPKPESDGTAAS